MSDKKKAPGNEGKTKNDEQEGFAGVPPASPDNDGDENAGAIDAEFEETPDFKPLVMSIEDDDEPVIVAEVVPQGPLVKLVNAEPSPLDQLLASLPKDKHITVIVKRRADLSGDSFRIPCTKFGHIDNLPWDGRMPDEIHADVKSIHCGGRYFFQLQYDGGLKESWDAVLFDPPYLSEIEKTIAKEKEPERTTEPAQPSAPPPAMPTSGEMLSSFKAEMLSWKSFFDEMRPETPAPAATVNDPIPIKDQIALAMLPAMSADPELGPQVVKKLLGISDNKGEKAWSDIAWYGITHAEEINTILGTVAAFAGPVIAGLFGKRPSPETTMQPGAPGTNTAPQTPAAGFVMPPTQQQPAGQKPAPAVPVVPKISDPVVVW